MNVSNQMSRTRRFASELPDMPMEIWQILIEQGNSAQANNAEEEAERLYLQAISECQNCSIKKADWLPLCLLHLGHLYESEGRLEKAEEVFEAILAIFEEIHGPQSSSVALMLDRMSTLCRAQGKHMEARALNIRASSIYNSTLRRKPALSNAS